MSSATKHDPRTGFNDIKPLAEGDSTFLLWALLIGSILLLVALLRRLRPKRRPVTKARTAAEFFEQLRILEDRVLSHSIDLRSAASLISQTVREYLEVRTRCDALELTPKELIRELRDSHSFPRDAIDPVVALVRGCERISFSDIDRSGDAELQAHVREAERVIEFIEMKLEEAAAGRKPGLVPQDEISGAQSRGPS